MTTEIQAKQGTGDWLQHHHHFYPSPDCHLCQPIMRVDLTGLEMASDKICKLVDELRAERDALRHALQALYDASPTSCEDKALNEAQKLAEKLL